LCVRGNGKQQSSSGYRCNAVTHVTGDLLLITDHLSDPGWWKAVPYLLGLSLFSLCLSISVCFVCVPLPFLSLLVYVCVSACFAQFLSSLYIFLCVEGPACPTFNKETEGLARVKKNIPRLCDSSIPLALPLSLCMFTCVCTHTLLCTLQGTAVGATTDHNRTCAEAAGGRRVVRPQPEEREAEVCCQCVCFGCLVK